jgi:hypothetical protein
MRYKYLLIILLSIFTFSACKDKENKDAEILLERINTQYENGEFASALRDIHTLRKKYPEAIEERKQALKIYQNVQLKIAQIELARVDSMLLRVGADYSVMKKYSDAHHAAGTATAAELSSATRERIKRDSLQTRFDVLCAKIKYIHRQQKEE